MNDTVQPTVEILVESGFSTSLTGSYTRAAGLGKHFRKLKADKQNKSEGQTVTVFGFAKPSELVRARKLVKQYSINHRPMIAVASPAVYNLPKFRDLFQSDLVEVLVEEPKNFHIENLDVWVTRLIQKPAKPKSEPRINISSEHLDVSASLRDPKTGRLDARKLAELMGISGTDLATKVCGISKQALNQSPFSLGIQGKLQPLEEIAQLLSWCGHDEKKLRAWLNRPNRDFAPLDGEILSPMRLILLGHADIVANEARNLRLGHPS